MLSKRLTLCSSALALLALALGGPLRAAELGEVKVNSHIGQQLSADIELVDLTAADLAEIQARLANPDVFKVAGLEVPAVPGGINIAVARRDNKRFLHLTTLQPVNADALHIFLELSSGGKQTIRAASLWLTPEPPTQRAARVAVAQPEPAAVVAPVRASSPESAEAGLNEAAQRAFAYRRQKALEQAQTPAAGQSTPSTSVKEASSATAPLVVASAPPAVAAPAAPTAAPIAPASKQPAAARRASVPAPAQPQSCAPEKQVEAQLQQCQAMTSKLSDLEGKVRRLQTTMVTPAGAAATTPATQPAAVPNAEGAVVKPAAAAAKPSSARAKPGATPVKPGVAADLAGNSRKRLFMIGGGVLAGLAALGGAIFFLRRRQAKGPLKIWQSFRRKGAAEAPEPVPEEAEQLAAQ